ncbi:hypothetical protein C8R47DRAFT_1171281, partial [Mycena vitilis]
MPPKPKPQSSSGSPSASPGPPEFPIQYSKIDGVSYRVTDNYGRALDPFIKLRGRPTIELKALLLNKAKFNEVDKSGDAASLPRLLVLNFEVLDFNKRAWVNREQPEEFHRLFYPIRSFFRRLQYEEYAPEFNGLYEKWKYLMPESRDPPPEPLSPKWKYPPQQSYFVREEPPKTAREVPKVEVPDPKSGRSLRSGPSPVKRGPPKTKSKQTVDSSGDESSPKRLKKGSRKRHPSPDSIASGEDEVSEREVVTKPPKKKVKLEVKKYGDNEMPDTSTNPQAYYDHKLNGFPDKNLDSVPPEEHWKFDTRVVTANAVTRASASKLPTTPRGAPWFPSNQKTPITTTLGSTGHQFQLQKYPPMVPRFESFPQISQTKTREIFKPVLSLLRDPGFSCIECILSNYFCEFRGFNHLCTACESKSHKACSFKYNDAQLERARLELLPWVDTGERQTLYLIAELHASMVRATIAHQAACFETQEMADKLAAFNEHADDVIKMVGVDCFNERFTESTSTVSMRDWVARLTDRANDLVSQQSARLDSKHVAHFNPNPDAHSGAGGSGARPTTPSFKQLEGGSGDGNDGLDLGQEAP